MEIAERFIQEFHQWALEQGDISGAFVAGSYGRKKAGFLSDVDIALLSTNAEYYGENPDWLKRFGVVWSAIYDANDALVGPSGSLFCAFSSGLTVDFALFPSAKTKLWLNVISIGWLRERFFAREAGQAAYLFQNEITVLFDKDGTIKKLDNLKHLPGWFEKLPAQKDFDYVLDDFYFAVLQIRRALLKEQLYAAESTQSKVIRRCLIKMASWEAQARQNGWQEPLLYREKHIETWADKAFVEALPIMLAAYGEETLWQAILKAIAVFRSLSQSLAMQLDFRMDERGREIEAWMLQEYENRHSIKNNLGT